MSFSHPKFDISKYKKFYQSIGAVGCPYFGHEGISFNRSGFTHLLRKDGVFRSLDDQKRRLKLLIYCRRILEGDYISVERSIDRRTDGFAEFWAFDAKIKDKTMRLIVRKVNNGAKHFFSIFPL